MRTDFFVDDYGTHKDGKTPDTSAIQKAIDACHAKGGGRVVVGAGRYLIGSIILKSHIELHLTAGAYLLASSNIDDYKPFAAEGFDSSRMPEQSSQVLISAADAFHISITGSGIIDGNGPAFYDLSSRQWGIFYAKPATPRPRMLVFLRCRDIVFEGVQFNNSPCWTFWLMNCERVRIHSISMLSDQAMINNDGIDIDGCRDIVISDSTFKTGDDCIAVRNMYRLRGDADVCEKVRVTNCLLDSWCQGIRVGCPGDGIIRDLLFSNIQIVSRGNGITLDYPQRYLPKDGKTPADVSDVRFSSISIRCEKCPIFCAVEEPIGLVGLGGISFSNLKMDSKGAVVLSGSSKTPLVDIALSQVEINSETEEPLVCKNINGLLLDRVSVRKTRVD